MACCLMQKGGVEVLQGMELAGGWDANLVGARVIRRLEALPEVHFEPGCQRQLNIAPPVAQFSVGGNSTQRIPDRVSIPRFRHLLEEHELSPRILQIINAKLAANGLLLKSGTVVDATLIAAPSSTKNSTGERDPLMHQVKKGNQWHFGMKAHIGVDADSGLVHTVIGTAANVNDVTQGHGLLHGEESVVFADAGYLGARKRAEAIGVDWHVAMRPGKRKAHKHTPWGALSEQAEKLKASVRAKVEHPFRVIKRQFGFIKVRYRGLKKNTAQLITLFALSNIWMARSKLLQRAQA